MMDDHFSAMNSFIKSAEYIKSADYLTAAKPVKKRSSGNAFGISRRKDYSSEEKLFFVNLVVEGGNSKASVAKQYDIPESTLRGWCKPKHKDKLEKEAHERKTAPNVFDTPSPSSSSSSAGSGVTPALYHPYKDSPYDHPITSTGIVPTLQIPKVESLYYPHPRPLIKEERDEEVLNLSNKTEHHLSSPILTQCLNTVSSKPEVSPGNSLKNMQHMKHSLLDIKSPSNLLDIHHNISSMFQSPPSSGFSADPTCKVSPKPSNSPSPVQYAHHDKAEDVNVNKRKFDAFVNDVNKEVSSGSPLDLYRKESPISQVNNNNNNSEFYRNYEQYLSSKRASDVYSKVEPKRELYSSSPSGQIKADAPAPTTPMNPYFKNYLESMVKAQKLPGAPNTPAGSEQFKLAAQQLWLQQLALNQLAASSMSQLPMQQQTAAAMQQQTAAALQQQTAAALQQQTAAALQQQQLLYERQLMNSRLNHPGGGHADEKIYTWTSQLHANQRELEEKLKLLIQTQQQILSDKSQSPPALSPSDTERVKRMRTMNVRDILESHRQSLETSRELPTSHERLEVTRSREEEMCVRRIEEDAEKEAEHSLDLTKSVEHARLESARVSPPRVFRTSPPVQEFLNRIPESPAQDSESHYAPSEHSEIRYKTDDELQYKSDSVPSETRYDSERSELRCKPNDELLDARYKTDSERDARHKSDNESRYKSDSEQTRYSEVDHNEAHLGSAIQHGEQFLEDLEKVSHPKLTLQHIRQLRDLLGKLRTPVENNNLRDGLEDANCKSKRKSLLNIVHNLTN